MAGYQLRALIVEDDELLSRTLHELLTDWGFEAMTAASLAQARVLLAEEWTLLLLDLTLSDGSGMDLAEELAHRPVKPLIVAVTGTATTAEAFELARLGARAYLPKPIRPHDLRETIRALLEESATNIATLESLVRAEVGSIPYQEVTARVRRAMVEQALALAGGSRTGAARLLHLSRQAVQQLIRSLELPDSGHG